MFSSRDQIHYKSKNMSGMGCAQGKPWKKYYHVRRVPNVQQRNTAGTSTGNHRGTCTCWGNTDTFNGFILNNGGRQSRPRGRGYKRRPKIPSEFRREDEEYYSKQPSYEELCKDYEEDNFETICYQMEQLILEKFEAPIGRSSTPSRSCFHCSHGHLYSCCLYALDTVQDAIDYAYFKTDLELAGGDRQNVRKIPEAFAGQTTPKGFPGYSYAEPEKLEPRPHIYTQKIPLVFVRQYLWPFIRHDYLEGDDPQKHYGVQNCCYHHYNYNYYRYFEPTISTRMRHEAERQPRHPPRRQVDSPTRAERNIGPSHFKN